MYKSRGRNNQKEYFVENLDAFRVILRSIYLYGCYSIKELTDEEKSPLMEPEKRGVLSKTRNRMERYLPDSFYSDETLSCSYQLAEDHDQVILDCFRYGRLSTDGVLLYFGCLWTLDHHRKKTFMQVIQDAQDELFPCEEISDTTAANQMHALENSGLILIRRSGKSRQNQSIVSLMEENCLDDYFTPQQLSALCRYLDFASRTFPLQVPFYHAWRKVRLACINAYLRGDLKEDDWRNDMLFRQNFLFDELDDDELYRFLYAVKMRRYVQIEAYENSPQKVNGYKIPLKAIEDGVTGRKYLLYTDEEGNAGRIRIDFVKRVRVCESISRSVWKERSGDVHAYDAVWCSSFRQGELKETAVHFDFTKAEPKEKERLKRRLQRESRGHPEGMCRLVWKDADHADLLVVCRDPDEMVPWLRTFYECVSVDDPALKAFMKEKLEPACQYYKYGKEAAGHRRQRAKGRAESHAAGRRKEKISLVDGYENVIVELLTYFINRMYYEKRSFRFGEIDPEAEKDLGISGARELLGIRKDLTGWGYGGILGRTEDGGICLYPHQKPVPAVLTRVEKEALVNAAGMKEARYFLSDALIEKVSRMMQGREPSWSLRDIEVRCRPVTENFADPLADNIRALQSAIRKGHDVHLIYQRNNGKRDRGVYTPLAVEYFSSHDTMIARIAGKGDYAFAMRVGGIREIRDAGPSKRNRELPPPDCWVILKLDDSYGLERTLRLFSCFEKSVRQIHEGEERGYEMKVSYYQSDEANIIRYILHSGSHALIQSCSCEELKEKIRDHIIRMYQAAC